MKTVRVRWGLLPALALALATVTGAAPSSLPREEKPMVEGRGPVEPGGRALSVFNGGIRYRVWIPNGVPKLRGVVLASMGNNWDYRYFVDIPAWQAAARLWGFALVGTGPKGSAPCAPAVLGPDVRKLLETAARESGHPEFVNLPVCVYGFSMGSAFTWGLCNAMPERVIAAGMGGSGHIPDLDRDAEAPAALKDIPLVVTAGELDNLVPPEKWKTAFAPSRRAGYRVALVTQWGLSHFEGNYENLLLVHFDRAIARRLPAEWDPALAPPQLRSIPLEQGWLGSPERCGEWGTLFVEACEAAKFAGDATQANWFVDGTVARTWQGYALRHNAAALIRPFVDSMEYIAGRDLPAPVRAGRPLTVAAIPYWFRGVTHVEFYAGADLIATCKAPNGEPDGQAYEAVWERPTPGVHPIYAILHNAKGARCITKPCPLVVEE